MIIISNAYLIVSHLLQENMTVEDVKMVDRYSQPRITAFLSEGRRQYFIVTEHRILCEIPTLQDALFYTFGSYYIFNLAHPKEMEKVLFFFPGLHYSTPDSVGRSSMYLAMASDIKITFKL